MHTIVGAGKAEGAMDAGNLLKPALARGELHCVGATTLDEYRKHIEKDAALARRFQPVFVNEPTVEDTISILRGLKEKYELHHGVRITDSALVAAATLSHRYITDRFLPDKAIDLVDEAASRLRMQVNSKPEELDAIDRDLMQMKIEREALKEGNGSGVKERLEQLEKSIADLEERRQSLTKRWKDEKTSSDRLRRSRRSWTSAGRSSSRHSAGAISPVPVSSPTASSLSLEKKLKTHRRRDGERRDGRRGSDAGADRGSRVAMDGHSRRQDARRRTRKDPEHGRDAG